MTINRALLTSGSAETNGWPYKAGPVLFLLSGTFNATVRLECSGDAGKTWVPLARDSAGSNADYATTTAQVIDLPRDGLFLRVRVTAYTSGTAAVELSQ